MEVSIFQKNVTKLQNRENQLRFLENALHSRIRLLSLSEVHPNKYEVKFKYCIVKNSFGTVIPPKWKVSVGQR